VSIHNVRADGTKYELFGPNAKGMLLDGSGHFALHVTRAGRPMFASENRMTGTAEENKAAVQGTISLVGSYTVNERDRSMLLRIDSSSYPECGRNRTKTAIHHYRGPTGLARRSAYCRPDR
jgi:Lipocalin-like domain